jgi:chromosome partitioning protein
MIIGIAGFKGGIGKTTTAVHFATYLQVEKNQATALVDGDDNRSAILWSSQSNGFPFKVISETQLAKYARSVEHLVIDTEARPDKTDLEDLLETCDLLILPSTPDFLALTAMTDTVKLLVELGSDKHKVLLTRVSTHSLSSDERDARELLAETNIPVFRGRIREYSVFKKAALAGVPVYAVKGDRNAKIAWNDYKSVIEEALNGQV